MTDKQKKDFEEWIQKEIEGVSLDGCWLDFSEEYRRPLNQFKVNKRGDLLIHRGRTKLNDGWEILIPRNRLTEPEWISHIKTKAYCDFGEFVRAYMKALEMAGIHSLTIAIYGFNGTCKYADDM